MLLDEPLVNLDYKLREELRDELSQLFDAGDTTVVYASTEPAEALPLRGFTAVRVPASCCYTAPPPRCSMRRARCAWRARSAIRDKLLQAWKDGKAG
ncbi:MAG: Carbohydrate transporter ATP-binding protein family [Ramlibacter sp.]|jgi:ABC-type nitrate/sulfonate/bicarbonate transport system ATPase subunit|nr:Carbohydrate transporter ATP-binding protein family [Ramlibacter sp.]